MSLSAVDENWYCEDCDLNFEYCDKPDFLFCPNCGKVLKNDMYQYNLDGLIDSFQDKEFVKDNLLPSGEDRTYEVKYYATVEEVIEKPSTRIGAFNKFHIWTRNHVKNYL